MPANVSHALLRDAMEFATALLSHYPHDEAGGKALAVAKIADLLKGYSPTYVLKGITKAYREAIYAAHYDHDFPGKTATEKQRSDYYSAPVNWFTPPDTLKEDTKLATEKNLTQLRSLAIVFPESLIDELLDKAVSLLTSPPSRAYDFYAMGVAVELLTGRRQYSEILTNGKFTPVGPQEIRVTGLAKTTLEGVTIPVIGVDSATLCKGVEAIQGYMQSRPWYRADIPSDEVKKKVDQISRDAIAKEFQPLIDAYYDDLLKVYGGRWYAQFPKFSTHDLRALWAIICYHRLNRETADMGVYIRGILGHTSEKNTRHYQTFKIRSDSDFAHWKKSIVPSYFS